jgi:N-acetylglutamate synthase-like GNAT family acetyltransferase
MSSKKVAYTIRETKPPLAEVMQLLAQTDWAKDRETPVITLSMDGSRVFAAQLESEQTIAIARLITDNATFAYICDFVVDEKYRATGIGKAMLKFILALPELAIMRRICLITKDAHTLYEKFGFNTSEHPERYMEILREHAPSADKLLKKK